MRLFAVTLPLSERLTGGCKCGVASIKSLCAATVPMMRRACRMATYSAGQACQQRGRRVFLM